MTDVNGNCHGDGRNMSTGSPSRIALGLAETVGYERISGDIALHLLECRFPGRTVLTHFMNKGPSSPDMDLELTRGLDG